MSERLLRNKSFTHALSQLKKHLPYSYCLGLFLCGLLLSLVLNFGTAYAQSTGDVETLTGYLEPQNAKVYTLANLKAGDTVYAYIKGISGNLDPAFGLARQRSDWSAILGEDLTQKIDQAIADKQDPLVLITELADELFLVWDDDSGEGYAAALEFQVPESGNYQLVIYSSPGTKSLGEYQLQVGINEPKVLTGEAKSTGAQILELEGIISAESRVAVENFTGSLTPEVPSTLFKLKNFNAGDILYVLVEGISGDLKPIVELRDYGDKLLRTENFSGEKTQASFSYKFQDSSNADFSLKLRSNIENDTPVTGEYRLLIGVNEPKVLTGNAEPKGSPIVQKSTPVQIGLRLQQITGINQKEENFGIVASLRMEYLDPALSFSPDTCQCSFKLFREDKFANFITENGLSFPAFTLPNQQGKRFSQNKIVVVLPNGKLIYFERFTATLQAPDFDFKRYPLDEQDFFIHIDSILPQEEYVFQELEGFTEIGEQLGEEEWIVTAFDTKITDQDLTTGETSDRFSFHFQAKRHLNYYILRLFIPILVIIIVSWLPFFLRDYGKRVDIASGNLLLFIAFNFTLSDDLPRLGYVTFLDKILICMFLISGLLVLLNVYLRRLEIAGKKDKAAKIDQFTIWGYPMLYLATFSLISFMIA